MVARTARGAGFALLVLIPLALFGIFFGYPVASLLGRGLIGSGGLDLTGFGDVLGRSRTQRILLFTIWQAAASAGLAVLLGIPGAYALYRTRFRGQRLLTALLTVPFVLPTVVVGIAFRALFASNGPLGSWGWDGSVAAILTAHVFLNYAVIVRTVGTTWAQLDSRPEQVARSLGAGPIRVFCTVTLPALGPAIAGAASMVFLFCATSFGIMLIMGGARYQTLETEIYRQTVDLLDLRAAAVLSIAQLVLVSAVLYLTSYLRRRTERTLRLRLAERRPITKGARGAIAVTIGTAAAFCLPMAVLVIRSLRTETGWSLDHYIALAHNDSGSLFLVPVTTALANSLKAALLAAVLAMLVGTSLSIVLSRHPRRPVLAAARSTLDAVVMVPLGVSAVTVGFGFLIALDKPPFDFRGSALLVPIAQATVTVPLVIRMVLPVLRGADDRLRQAAGTLGAGPIRTWLTVDLPLMGKALAGAAAFAFAVALGEFGATSFVARPQAPTLPVVIARLISQPGNAHAGMAMAAASILAAICALSVFVVDRVAGREVAGMGGF